MTMCFLAHIRVWAMLVLAIGTGLWVVPASAGNPVEELRFRYSCSPDRGKFSIEYRSVGRPWTVGVELGANNEPIAIINERTIYEQPFEVVAFEYFSACEQVRILFNTAQRTHMISNNSRAKRMLFEADCKAIGRMGREGLIRGSRSARALLDALRFQRAKQVYMTVLYSDRADNIQRKCPP